jgi:hypothetical protein
MDVNIKEQERKSTRTDRPSNFKIGVVAMFYSEIEKIFTLSKNHITRILEINR